MSDGRLRLALTRAAFVMEDCADAIYVEATSYEEKPCPKEFWDIVVRLRKAAKAGREARDRAAPAGEGRRG